MTGTFSINPTTIENNSVSQIQATFTVNIEEVSGPVMCEVWSEDDLFTFSKDNVNFDDYVDYTYSSSATGGSPTFYIQCGSLQPGTYELSYEIGNWSDSLTGTVNLTVTESTVENHFESLSFGLNPRESTVQFNATVVNDEHSINDTIYGTMLDYHYNFTVENVAEQGKKQVLSGASLAEKLAHSLIVYQVDYDWSWSQLSWERPTINDHLYSLFHAINVPYVYRGRTFTPKTDMNVLLANWNDFEEQLSGSFSEIMNRLFGWSDSAPSMTYNLYVENGTVYIIERGYETNSGQNALTPTHWVMAPTLTHSIRRTEWSNSANQTVVPKQIASSDNANSNKPFDGTITWNGNTLTYENGYLTQESHTDNNGDVTTTTYQYNEYNNAKYLWLRETTVVSAGGTDDKYTVTEYDYEQSGTNIFLAQEDYQRYDGQSAAGTLQEHYITTYSPIGNGWYGMTKYSVDFSGNKEEIDNSMSQGAPGNRVSQYMIDTSNDALKPSSDPNPRQMTVPLRGVARVRQTYPVADRTTLQAIANCLDTYEKKEEITLRGELVNENHIYTYDDKIVYKGNEYYLVSNNVTKTANTVRQSITAVRWVLS